MIEHLRRLPYPARLVLRGGLTYVQRLGRWAIVLSQVRGAGWRDQLALLASAAAAPVTSLHDLQRWQDPVLLLDAKVKVKSAGNFRVRKLTDDLWHVLPWRERAIHKAMRRLLKPGMIFVDAGANIGIYTLLASRLVGPTGRVLAIEMMPETAAMLRRHVEENRCGNVTIVERALTDRDGDVVSAHIPAGKFGQASVVGHSTRHGAVEEIKVRTATLDTICKDIGRIDLIKLDLEGAEMQALRGGDATLARTNRVIFEHHTNADALDAVFARAGFVTMEATGRDRIVERPPAAGNGHD